MTQDEVLAAAQSKWPTQASRESLAAKYGCSSTYIYKILTNNKRMPAWMLGELGIEQVRVTEYRRR